MLQSGQVMLPPHTELLLFGAFFLAFAIKVPLFPLHTWLPDAHTEAPTAGSVILAGVMLKLGTYGILRFCLPLFLKRRIGWLSRSPFWPSSASYTARSSRPYSRFEASGGLHLGEPPWLCVLGIFAFNTISIQGAVYQMLSHGISTGALFLGVGMLYDRRHTTRSRSLAGWRPPCPC
jgi:NADH-quinone oxidoreductase subunit M